jgi:hypothetical protein
MEQEDDRMIEVIIRDHEDGDERIMTGDFFTIVGIKGDPVDDEKTHSESLAIGKFNLNVARSLGVGIGKLLGSTGQPSAAKLAFVVGFDSDTCKRAEKDPLMKVKHFFRRWTEC